MEIAINESPNATEIELNGDLTIRFIEKSKRSIDAIPKNANRIIVNLKNVHQIDSAGIQFLMAWKRNSELENRSLEFINHSPKVLSILDLYGLVGFFGDKIKISKRDANLYSFHYGKKKGSY